MIKRRNDNNLHLHNSVLINYIDPEYERIESYD